MSIKKIITNVINYTVTTVPNKYPMTIDPTE